MSFEKTNILGTMISVLDCAETCDAVAKIAATEKSEYVCISNVHTVTEAASNRDFLKVNNEAVLATADGVPLLWASKILSGPQIHGRASGPDILFRFVTDKKYVGLKHYFYGASPEVLKKLTANLRALNPEFKIVGEMSPPIRKAASIDTPLIDEEKDDIAAIAASGADLIWVGLGAPKQEIFMYRARTSLPRGVMLGVGAAFDFLSGNKKRAPLWMQKSGLEWFHRLLSEPTRLTSRYLKTNPKFVAAILKQKLMS